MEEKQIENTSGEDLAMEQRIIEAAEKLFLDKGFTLTTTTEIAKNAGCNQALVHYYFRTKDRLFQRIFEKKATFFIESFINIESYEGSFTEKLAKIIEAHFDLLYANPKLPFLLHYELTLHPERLLDLKNMVDIPWKMLDQFRRNLENEISKGGIRKVDMYELMFTAVSLNVFTFISRPVVQKVLDLSDRQMEHFILKRKQEIVTTVINSLRP